MTVLISNLAIAGYRSFGPSIQHFENFSKINLLIGQNNAGKSNVLRFIQEVFRTKHGKTIDLGLHAYHLSSNVQMLIGVGIALDDSNKCSAIFRQILRGQEDIVDRATPSLRKLFSEKARQDGTSKTWSYYRMPNMEIIPGNWTEAHRKLSTTDAQQLWNYLTNLQGGDRRSTWEPTTVQRVQIPLPEDLSIEMIPAVRQIGAERSTPAGFDGAGIIERLAKLQNPDVNSQRDREKFVAITQFLRNVIGNDEATIEIPHQRDTIIVHMDGKTLPIQSLGSGVHEVIILAAAATVLSDHVVCIEEPEIHLNPILQRKLIRYLSAHTSNQYFITTHSPALMDTPGAEIYHIRMQERVSTVERVTSDRQRSLVCEDLGYHPSDLLQANCIIWVEGPSDRIYINYWLKAVDPELIEGIHYSVMFYGGRLAAHLSNEDLAAELADFISLRRLNRRGAIVMDSDRAKKGDRINETKLRLRDEFDKSPGLAWITDGREVENYIPAEHLKMALSSVAPTSKPTSAFGKYDNALTVKKPRGADGIAPKVEIARYIAANLPSDLSVLDLKGRLAKLTMFIRESNPQHIPR